MAFSYSELSSALASLVQWEVFAKYIPGITESDIERIKTDEHGSVAEQKVALFSKWLQVFPDASWSYVVRALKKARDIKLAEEIESKYVTKYTEDTGISSMTVSTPADHSDSYPYNTPVPATTYERSQLESGQQDTQNQESTTTEIHPSDVIEELEERLKTGEQYKTLQEQNQKLIQQRIQYLQNNSQLTERNKKLEESLSLAKHRYNEIHKSNQESQADIQKRQQAIDALHNERDQQKILIQNISSENSKMEDTCQQLDTNNRQLQTELANSNRELIEMKTRKEKENEQLQLEHEQLKSRLQSMKEELAKLEQLNKDLHGDRTRIMNGISERDRLQHNKMEELKQNIRKAINN